MAYRNIIVGLIFLINLQSYSQNTQTLKGNLLYEGYSFIESIEKYEGIKEKTNGIKRKLAESYYKSGDYIKSEEYFSQLANDENRLSDDIYNYAFVLSVNKKYIESQKWMELFNEINSFDSRGKQYAENKGFYKNLLKDKSQFKIKNISYNTEQEDFGTSYFKDKIVFTSSRTNTQFVDRKWNWNKLPYLDLFIAEIDSAGFTKVKTFKKSINKKYHEGPASFNETGTFMVFTRNNYYSISKDNVNKLQLYFSEFTDDEWKEPSPFLFNNKEYSTGHASLTSDGKALYLASDMPGGFGGVDLYVSNLNSDNVWTEPVNLGQKINTEGNEMFPFIHHDGYLFFASDGLLGLGGLDVFMSKISESGFSNPKNIGLPVNSSNDDFAFIIDKEMKTGYFSSNRKEGKGDDDIYSFNMLKPFGLELIGTAKDEQGNLLAETQVILLDNKGKMIGIDITDDSGKFSFNVEPDKNYTVKGKKETFVYCKNDVSTESVTGEIRVDVILSKIPDISSNLITLGLRVS